MCFLKLSRLYALPVEVQLEKSHFSIIYGAIAMSSEEEHPHHIVSILIK